MHQPFRTSFSAASSAIKINTVDKGHARTEKESNVLIVVAKSS